MSARQQAVDLNQIVQIARWKILNDQSYDLRSQIALQHICPLPFAARALIALNEGATNERPTYIAANRGQSTASGRLAQNAFGGRRSGREEKEERMALGRDGFLVTLGPGHGKNTHVAEALRSPDLDTLEHSSRADLHGIRTRMRGSPCRTRLEVSERVHSGRP